MVALRSLEPETILAANDAEPLIKSRERVDAYGEVFTPKYMVASMLDLVQAELERDPEFVNKTFFEPAAGDGNFLVAILHRKLVAIQSRFTHREIPNEALFALASIYGIELLRDNCEIAQSLMLAEFVEFLTRLGIECGPETDIYCAARHIISVNVKCGNTLTGFNEQKEPLIFSWWHRVEGDSRSVCREDFTFASLREAEAGLFDFFTSPDYAICHIDQVQEEILS